MVNVTKYLYRSLCVHIAKYVCIENVCIFRFFPSSLLNCELFEVQTVSASTFVLFQVEGDLAPDYSPGAALQCM